MPYDPANDPEINPPTQKEEGPSLWRRFLDLASSKRSNFSTAGGVIGGVAGGLPGLGIGTAIGNLAGQGTRLTPEQSGMMPQGLTSRTGKPFTPSGTSPAPPPVAEYTPDYGAAAADALESLPLAWAGGKVLQAAAGKAAAPIASRFEEAIPAGANPFANLSGPTFARVHEAATAPSPRMMAAPRGDLAETGGRFATPRVAESALRGGGELQRIAAPLAEDARIGQAGARGAKTADFTQTEMAAEAPAIWGDKARAVDSTRQVPGLQHADPESLAQTAADFDKYDLAKRLAQPGRTAAGNGPDIAALLEDSGSAYPYSTPGPQPRVPSGVVKMRPPGEEMVNKAVNEPNAINAMMSREAEPAQQAIDSLKTRGFDQNVRAEVKGPAFSDALKARAQGITPDVAEVASRDATELESLGRAMHRQRSGVAQNSPKRGAMADVFHWGQEKLAGPKSTMGGFRPETPETAVLSNTARLAEQEAARRGMPVRDQAARDAATVGLSRPSPAPRLHAALQDIATAEPGERAAMLLVLHHFLDQQKQK